MKQKNPGEDSVELVLNELVEKKIPIDKVSVVHFLRNRPSDRLDTEGIDFLIFLSCGLTLPLQVKTANGRLDSKSKEHKRKHPFVNFIIFVRTDLLPSNPEEVYKEIRRDLISMIRGTFTR